MQQLHQNFKRTLLATYAFVLISIAPSISNAQQRINTYGIEKSDDWVCKVYSSPIPVRQYTLKNGLTIIMARNESSPTIDTRIAVKAGSKNDPASNTGLAHYLEHMLFKGTDKYGTLDFAKEKVYLDQIDALYENYNSTKDEAKRKVIYTKIDSISNLASKFAIANEYDKMMQVIGATGTNAYTSVEQTVYVNTIPNNEVHRWLEIESERFRNPILRLFHTELEAVYEEKNISMDNDYSKVFETMDAALFKKHTYGTQTTIGTVEHLKNPSLLKIREYYKTYYVPNNMAIIMVGDFGFDSTINMIVEHFSYMQSKVVPEFKFGVEYPTGKPQTFEITGSTEPSVWIGYRLPGTNTKEAVMAEMVDMLLSNSSAGLFDLNLVKSQKVLNAASYINGMKDYTLHYLFGNPKNGQTLKEVERQIKEQLNLLKEGKFSDSLMESITLDNRISKIKSYESNSGIIDDLSSAFIYETEWMEYYNREYYKSKITKQEIIDFVKEYYTEGHAVIYKMQGKPEKSEQIDKPKITPVELNRGKTSGFVTNIIAEKVTPIKPQFTDLKKELQIDSIKNAPYWYVKNTTNDLFTLYYVLDLGRFHDKMLPLAVQYLSYVGAGIKSADAVAQEFYQLGSTFSVFTGDDESYVYLSGIQSNFGSSVKLFESLFSNPSINTDAFASMIEDIKTERENNKSDKGSISRALRSYAIYGADNPFNYQINNSDLDNITAQQLIDYIKKMMNYKHTVMYYGPAEQDIVKNSITDLHQLPTAWLPAPNKKVFTKVGTEKTNVYFAQYDGMVQAQISWTKRANMFDINQMAINELHTNYFGGGMSGVVFQTIRESKSLAYSSYSVSSLANEKGEYNTVFSFVGTQSDKMKDAIIAMNALHQDLPLNEANFTQAKSAAISEMNTERIQKTGLLFFNKTLMKMGLEDNYKPGEYAQIQSYNITDIANYHNQLYAQAPFNYCIVGDKTVLDIKYLKTLGTFQEIDLGKLFGY